MTDKSATGHDIYGTKTAWGRQPLCDDWPPVAISGDCIDDRPKSDNIHVVVHGGYRRYASTSLVPLAREYLEYDARSLQDVVAPDGRVIGYVTPTGQPQSDDRALDRSTFWRFLAFLGTQVTSLQTGLQLLSEREPLSTLHRFLGAVAPHKYRSPQRGEDLRTARRLLHLLDQWDRTFHEPFFPRYATKSRGP